MRFRHLVPLASLALVAAAAASSLAVKRRARPEPAKPAQNAAEPSQKPLLTPPTQEPAGPLTRPFSARVVAYEINAKLDPQKKTIDATETLRYHNLTGQPLDTFPFHLYLNAFQPRSTFMTETHQMGTRGTDSDSAWNPKRYGAINVKSFSVEGIGDLTGQMQFIHPDDQNANDRTVFQVKLPKPVAPNDWVTFQVAFHDQLPEVMERTGYKRNFFMVGQWFPKVGVWWHGAWNCHQFHANTEFFADFGTYDVHVTVPDDYITGAVGDKVSTTRNPDGTKTVAYQAADVHDFSWTASPRYRDVEDSWTGSAGLVHIHLLMSPGHESTTNRYLHALKGALAYFDKTYGPYPYDTITVVDPPNGAIDAGGMEYPTLITAGTAWWMPKGVLEPEVVVVHEFGHQYWYGMVATDEFEEAWLDEGINTYSEVKVMDALYGPSRSALDFHHLTAGDSEEQRLSYLSLPDTDPLTRFAWQYMNSQAYGAVTYGKTATVLLTLQGMIGEKTMERALRTYFLRYRFTHPTGADFLNTLNEVAGQNLNWYFDQAVSGTNILDYEVFDMRSSRVDWWEPRKKGETLYDDTVLIHRKGDFVFPIQVHVRFDDGKTVEAQWDGRDRWVRFSYVRPDRVVSAEIDPQHKVWLDRNLFNNSRTTDFQGVAVGKLSVYCQFLEQLASQILSWLG
jgi:hypothetical protein